MQHKFTRVAIKLGERYSIEICQYCGLESQRYKTTRLWIVDGKISNSAPECTRSKVDDIYTKYDVPVPVESIMEDATVIIKVLYDDMMQAWGFANGQGMLMARRFLESKGMEI